MPSEKFYAPTAVEGDRQEPYLTIQWGHEPPQVLINGQVRATPEDYSALTRIVSTLVRARTVMAVGPIDEAIRRNNELLNLPNLDQGARQTIDDMLAKLLVLRTEIISDAA